VSARAGLGGACTHESSRTCRAACEEVHGAAGATTPAAALPTAAPPPRVSYGGPK